MASRYWVGGTDTWNTTAGSKWAATSGGAGGESAPTTADDVFFDAASGSVTVTTAAGAACKNLDATGFTGTLTPGATMTVAGTVFKLVAGMTLGSQGGGTVIDFTATSGTVAITSAGKVFTSGIRVGNSGGSATYQLQDGLTMGGTLTRAGGTFDANGQTVTMTGLNQMVNGTFTGTSAFFNLIRTGTASKVETFTLIGNIEVTGTLTINGDSAINRVQVLSSVFGTQRTITAAAVSVSNADFRDIVGAGAATWDLSAATGGSGDCGGNSGITFTTPATQTATGTASFTWSTHGWTSRVPLPQDDVVINNAFVSGRIITVDMPRLGKTIDMSGATWSGTAPVWSNSAQATIYGSLLLPAGITYTSGGTSLFFEGRGAFSLDQDGATITTSANIVIQMIGGTLTLLSAFSAGTGTITHSNGTFDDDGFSVTTGVFASMGAATRAVVIDGTWTLTSTGTVWNVVSSLGVSGSGTIVVSNTSSTAKTFSGAGLTYGSITFSGDNITVAGSNTFTGTFAVNNAALANGLKLTSGTTQTVGAFSTNGSAGNLAILVSTSAGSAATLSKASGTVSVDYMSIKDSTATGGAAWYAGANSTSVSGNTGWTFTAPPGGGPAIPVFINQYRQRWN